MKLFGRSGGHWLFWISAIYFLTGIWSVFNGIEFIWLSPLYILFLSMPFLFPPLGRAINLDVGWDHKMFEWFKRKEEPKYVPEGMCAPKTPDLEVKPPKREESPKIYYRFGLTDNNRVAFSMGYSEITMNREGCQNLIDQITFFMDQLEEIEEENE